MVSSELASTMPVPLEVRVALEGTVTPPVGVRRPVTPSVPVTVVAASVVAPTTPSVVPKVAAPEAASVAPARPQEAP